MTFLAQGQQGLQPYTWKGKPQDSIVQTLGRSSQSRCCRWAVAGGLCGAGTACWDEVTLGQTSVQLQHT
jgi:hypothetical protein